jgi:PKD repeat protein
VAINNANQGDWGQAYLDNFYATSKTYSSMMAYPGTWKGFNDTAASWTQNRIMSQNCGEVWLQTFAELGKYFTGTQAQGVQLVTWNDYEEGTEIETGIDNCVSVNASATSAGDVSWTISGQENTIDHYTVFISTDAQNLMKLTDVAAGTHTYSLASFGFAAGNYTVFVKAVGKPSMRNKMSAAVPVTLGGNVAPTAKLSVTPNTGTIPVAVTASTAGSTDPDGTIASTRIDFGDGTVMAVPSGSHIYSKPGTYTVTATVTDNNGATGTAMATVTAKANQPPVASMAVSPATGTAPVTVTASTAASTDTDGTIASSTIDFGDGTVANGPTASHTYNNAGSFTVKGTVKDNGGLSATSSTTVTVAAATSAFTVNAISPADNTSITGPVHFVATTSSGSPVTAVRVYIDNMSVYTVNAGSLDITLRLTPGSHYVVLQAWNQAGAVAKTPLHITVVNQPPSVSLLTTPSSGVAPVLVSATASGTDTDGTITSTSIDFGDGTVVNGATGMHTYSVVGTYTVTAKVTDNNGAASTAKSTVSVIPNGITLNRPTPNSIVTGPVAITATAGAANPIVAMRVYVDNMATYSLNSFSSSVGILDTILPMSKGLHNVVVQAWDSKGTVYKTSAVITVQ